MSEATIRARLVAEARQVTTDQGWAAVTMQGLADAVGVSRQTVYNEVGGKASLAEALVLDELDRFLAVVDEAFTRHPTDLVAAIRAAVEAVLEYARDNNLLRAVVSATHGADTDLLPLLTTNSAPLLTVAKAVLLERVHAYPVDLDAHQLDAAVDLVVRVVLSHVMQPSAEPAATAADIAEITSRILT